MVFRVGGVQGVPRWGVLEAEPRLPLLACAQEFLDSEATVRADGTKDAPSLVRFEVQIARYRGLQEEVAALPNQAPLGFVRADARPAKAALTAWISKWIFLYTQCLSQRVRARNAESPAVRFLLCGPHLLKCSDMHDSRSPWLMCVESFWAFYEQKCEAGSGPQSGIC